MTQEAAQKPVKRFTYVGEGVALGTALGAAIGVALNDIATWTGVGAALGVALGAAFSKPRRKGAG